MGKPRRTRTQIIRESHPRADECVAADRDTCPKMVTILNRNPVADPNSGLQIATASDIAIETDDYILANVREGPDASPEADPLCLDLAVEDDRCHLRRVVFHLQGR
jgi:hypothetical protein